MFVWDLTGSHNFNPAQPGEMPRSQDTFHSTDAVGVTCQMLADVGESESRKGLAKEVVDALWCRTSSCNFCTVARNCALSCSALCSSPCSLSSSSALRQGTQDIGVGTAKRKPASVCQLVRLRENSDQTHKTGHPVLPHRHASLLLPSRG